MELPGLFVKMTGGNVTKVTGSENIVIQDIKGSTININETQTIVQEITKLLSDRSDIYFVIITDNIDHEWSPFGSRTILDMIKDATENVKEINSILCFFEPTQMSDDIFIAFLKFKKRETILILNNDSLDNAEIKMLAGIYNDFHIGGCLTIGSNESFAKSTAVFNHNMAYFRDPLRNLVGGKRHLSINRAKNDDDLVNELVEIISVMGHAFISGISADQKVGRSLSSL